MENDKTLKTRTGISQSSDLIHTDFNLLFTDRVMSTSVIVGSIFLSSNELFRVEQLTVCPRANFIYNNELKHVDQCVAVYYDAILTIIFIFEVHTNYLSFEFKSQRNFYCS